MLRMVPLPRIAGEEEKRTARLSHSTRACDNPDRCGDDRFLLHRIVFRPVGHFGGSCRVCCAEVVINSFGVKLCLSWLSMPNTIGIATPSTIGIIRNPVTISFVTCTERVPPDSPP